MSETKELIKRVRDVIYNISKEDIDDILPSILENKNNIPIVHNILKELKEDELKYLIDNFSSSSSHSIFINFHNKFLETKGELNFKEDISIDIESAKNTIKQQFGKHLSLFILKLSSEKEIENLAIFVQLGTCLGISISELVDNGVNITHSFIQTMIANEQNHNAVMSATILLMKFENKERHSFEQGLIRISNNRINKTKGGNDEKVN